MAAGASRRWRTYLNDSSPSDSGPPDNSPSYRGPSLSFPLSCAQPAWADHKLLQTLQIGDQQALVIVHTLRALLTLNWPVMVVVDDSPHGSQIAMQAARVADQHGQPTSAPVLIHRVAAGQTLGDSMADGMDAIHTRYPGSRVLVALADMPWILQGTLQKVAKTLDRQAEPWALVRPSWQGQMGHPVGVGAAWIGLRDQLRGQAGARAWFKQPQAQVVIIPSNDPGVILDIDTPEDLEPQR